MRYPTANLGALGRATLFPGAAAVRPAPAPRLAGRVLGITASTEDAAARLRNAQTVFESVQRTYPKLVGVMGEASAQTAFDQANAALAAAQRDYEDALRASGAGA